MGLITTALERDWYETVQTKSSTATKLTHTHQRVWGSKTNQYQPLRYNYFLYLDANTGKITSIHIIRRAYKLVWR